jgi:hypothetical protein
MRGYVFLNGFLIHTNNQISPSTSLQGEGLMPVATGDKARAKQRFWHPVHDLVIRSFKPQQASSR